MSEAVQIRPMERGDIEEVIVLAERLRNAPEWPRSAYESALNPTATVRRVCLVASNAGQAITGFVIASLVGVLAEIESIGVAPEAQQQGIGRRLVAELISQVRKRGVAEVLLEVRESNRAAAALYRAAGFAESGRRPGYYRNPEEDAVLYALSLESSGEI